jgi:hypothetical protein
MSPPDWPRASPMRLRFRLVPRKFAKLSVEYPDSNADARLPGRRLDNRLDRCGDRSVRHRFIGYSKMYDAVVSIAGSDCESYCSTIQWQSLRHVLRTSSISQVTHTGVVCITT